MKIPIRTVHALRAVILLVLVSCLGVPILAAGQWITGFTLPYSYYWQEPLAASTSDFSPAPAGCGTVTPDARIASFSLPDGKIHVALDADTATATQFNCLRIDFSGTGRFADATVVTLQHNSTLETDRYFYIAPQGMTVFYAGTKIPLTVSGMVTISKQSTYLRLEFNVVWQDTCTFGEITHKIRVIDVNNNLHVGDRFSVTPPAPGLNPRGVMQNGDLLVVDLGDGKFTKTTHQFYGQPILVDGALYDVTLANDGTVSVRPFDKPTGTISFEKKYWNCTLVGTKYVLLLSGERKPVPVPVDTYLLSDFTETTAKNPMGFAPTVTVSYPPDRGKPVVIQHDAVTQCVAGAPVTAKIAVTQQGRIYTFSFAITDAAGGYADLMTGSTVFRGGKVPFAVYDAKGKQVYASTFEHG